ncbi:MAG: hypothetical protein AAFQ87_12730 [Bacteroidota bacterium]
MSSGLELLGQNGIRDSLFWFKAPLASDMYSAPREIADLKGSFGITLDNGIKFKTVERSFAQKAKVPFRTKFSRAGITLSKGGKCYRFSCASSKGCMLIFFDKNQDGKVQPRRELRCIDSKGNECQMIVKEVRCQ